MLKYILGQIPKMSGRKQNMPRSSPTDMAVEEFTIS